ncbi:MAG: TolB-like protein [Phenylobacterium sp.]|jgi:TolB-like protein
MKVITVFISVTLSMVLSGCMSTFFAEDSRLCIGDNGVYQRCEGAQTYAMASNAPIIAPGMSIEEQQRELSMASMHDNQSLFEPGYHHKVLGEYVEQLAINLMQSVDGQSFDGPVAITSFVQFDSTLNRSDILGNQLSELFFVELQQFGVPVIDYKVTPSIKVTSSGDFVFSRNPKDLARQQSVGYVLSGTLMASDRGVVVNARIINLKNQGVVATAKGLIPSFVLPGIYTASR